MRSGARPSLTVRETILGFKQLPFSIQRPVFMIDLYTWLTPNGRKISLMLEEIGCGYRVCPINIGRGEQFSADFLAINPNGKVPAIVDHDGPGGIPLTLFESNAILTYLAEKFRQFLPAEPVARLKTLQWLHFQGAHIGPMLGQAQHFFHYATEKVPYAINRYVLEAKRLYGVLDIQLHQHPYVAGSDYTIADIAMFPWIRPWKIQGVAIEEFPNVGRWIKIIEGRPAVARERGVLAEYRGLQGAPLDDQARRNLFDRMA
jgi:GSH-dependent disulfide-bond oxidoreductase